MFNINILQKQLEDATNNKSFENPMFRRKVFHKNKQAPKNKNKITRRVWVEKGTTHSRNINCVTCLYCMQKGHSFRLSSNQLSLASSTKWCFVRFLKITLKSLV